MEVRTIYTLTLLPEMLAVCRFPARLDIPDWAWTGPVQSVTRTADELSIVCAAGSVPEGVQVETGWQALRLAGPLDFSLIGLLASLTGTLAEEGISVFVVSTFDTDYILVRSGQVTQAVRALRQAGHWVLTGHTLES